MELPNLPFIIMSLYKMEFYLEENKEVSYGEKKPPIILLEVLHLIVHSVHLILGLFSYITLFNASKYEMHFYHDNPNWYKGRQYSCWVLNKQKKTLPWELHRYTLKLLRSWTWKSHLMSKDLPILLMVSNIPLLLNYRLYTELLEGMLLCIFLWWGANTSLSSQRSLWPVILKEKLNAESIKLG